MMKITLKNIVSATAIFVVLSLITLGLTSVKPVQSYKEAQAETVVFEESTEMVKEITEEAETLVKEVAPEEQVESLYKRPLNDREKARKFRQFTRENGIKAKNKGDYTLKELHQCQAVVYETLIQVSEEHISHLKKLTLNFDPAARRGLGGGDTIKLRCANLSDAEISSVLVHEIGHIVDTGLNTGTRAAGDSGWKDGRITLYNNDLSLGFYQISWADETELKEETDPLDFVSGYAMSDPFEDFAESYNFYRLNGANFRYLAASNEALEAKYLFLKENVFQGQEFGLEELPSADLPVTERKYDATKLPYDYQTFLTQ